jgi:hypothetical protein
MEDEHVRWSFSASGEEFERFRDNPQFATLLTLARVVNGLQFCFHAMLEPGSGDEPAHLRQRMNPLLFSAGVLHEGFAVAQTLGKHFRERESYRTGFRKLLADPVTQKLRSTVMQTMRNDIAFHFNPDVAATVLKTLKLDKYVFVMGVGPQEGQTYFQLADEVVFNHLVDAHNPGADERQILREMFSDFSYVTSGFIKAAQVLIPDVLIEMGWEGNIEAAQENN